MKVVVFDEQHEEDLSETINEWIQEVNPHIIDIRFSTCAFSQNDEQIYCFSALILYQIEE